MLSELTEQVQSETDARCQSLFTEGLVRSFREAWSSWTSKTAW